MNRILVLEGYTNPFGGPAPRTRSKHLGGSKMARRKSSVKRQQSKMKSCAASWRRAGKHGSYRAHMKRCLSK